MDFTTIVDAAAKTLHTSLRARHPQLPDWDDLDAYGKAQVREAALPYALAAAEPLLTAVRDAVLAAAKDTAGAEDGYVTQTDLATIFDKIATSLPPVA